MRMKRTFSPRPDEIERRWFVVDASGIPVGRLSTAIARLIMGKHKPIYAPHVDCGDFVIVVNAEKSVLTGQKEGEKTYYRHSGQPGGLKAIVAGDVRRQHPARLVESAVHGMLPKSSLGRKLRRKLKVYAGAEHPHHAQKPEPFVPGAAS
jgi:large subunit ribosomal protein L13